MYHAEVLGPLLEVLARLKKQKESWYNGAKHFMWRCPLSFSIFSIVIFLILTIYVASLTMYS